MSIITPVLVAIDIYSEYGRILKQALGVAKKPHFCHVIFVVLPFSELQPYLSEKEHRLIDANERQGRLRLMQIANQCRIPPSNVHLHTGSVAKKVCCIADSIDAGLIVIGSHGRGGMAPLLGSNTHKVLQKTKRDVLTVRLIEPNI